MDLTRPGLRAKRRSVGTASVSAPVCPEPSEGLVTEYEKLLSSSGVGSGDGEGRVTWMGTLKEDALCGRGEMSMRSPPGEDEGTGGVVEPSKSTGGVTRLSVSCGSMKLALKRERRGVGN